MGPIFFNLFINDLAIKDYVLIGPKKLSWHVIPKNCNELILCKQVAHDIDPLNNIMQVTC